VHVTIDYRPALRQPSGAGEYIRRLVEALRDLDGTVDLTIFSSSRKDRLDTTGLDGVHAVDRRVPVAVLNAAWHWLEWPPVERLTGRPTDVAHSPHPLLLPTRTGAQVLTIHDVDFLKHPERTAREIRRDYPRLARAHARRADRILVPSSYAAGEVMTHLLVPRERVSLCPPGAPDWAAREREPAAGYILFVGTLEPRKNLDRLLTAYASIRARRPSAPGLRLAGRATDESGTILDRLREPPLAGAAEHVGYVPEEQQRALYLGAVMLVIPSLEEGFGLPALEAMSLGVPIVSSNRGSLPEVLGSAGLLVDPERPDELAAAIERLLDEPGLRERLSAEGTSRAKAFTWRDTARRVVEAYGQAIERRRRGAA
jgi:glycosyltransferase involved in cell wall biosynthesis